MSSLFSCQVNGASHIIPPPALTILELSDPGQNQLNIWGHKLYKLWDLQLYKGEDAFCSPRDAKNPKINKKL